MAWRGTLAGQRLIERRHCPRGLLDAALTLEIENGLPVLPEIVLWALNLQEGDLLTVEERDGSRFCFQSYLCELEFLLDTCYVPWPYVEPVLRKSMAAVGPNGTLLLPDEAEALWRPQEGSLILRQLILPAGMFTLRRTAEPPSSPPMSLAEKPD